MGVVIPTYKEAENLPRLLSELSNLRSEFKDFEVLIMDDQSPDGTPEVFAASGVDDWAKLVLRTGSKGLSPAVAEGVMLTCMDYIVVMDADLSHNPAVIPKMVSRLVQDEADFVLGSRYIPGAEIEGEWGWFRHLNSQVATLLARPFVKVRDPMSGFFAFKRSFLDRAPRLNPVGYKIGLELMVKLGFDRIVEEPIYFSDRDKGESKLSLKEQLNYIRHLFRLGLYKIKRLFGLK